ncbi:T9SS type A sorting domain-containing protein [Flavobacterium fluviatile]|uniref:T9SS type A sorting domain-containing protein n=1 Tax=Flavobacterium fluviatile TaxID=1862387 RepID=UPI0013D67E1D|nr:T9SS type A sorting domain-containing protein [Flavobacterium fluviatile]
MTKKLLFTLLSFALFSISYSQQEATDYISGLDDPSAMINKGNILYVQGSKNLYEINTASGSPTANVIYTAAANFYMTNLTISGNIIYISEENYDEVNNTSSGCRIVAFDINNPGAPVNVIYTTPNYVSALAITGSTIYFASEAEIAHDDYVVQILKIDVNNPIATVVVNNLAEDVEASDMAFYSNNLMISVGGVQKVFGFDITDPVITVTEYMKNLGFNKGLFVNGNNVFIADGNRIGTKPLNLSTPLTFVAQNTTYKDPINTTPISFFNANFRDVVLIGDKLFMTLLNQGKVVTVQDATLSKDKFNQDLKAVSVSNSKTTLTVTGLENNSQAGIYNISGQLITSKELSANENSIDISSYSHGVYIIKLGNKSFKFIK